MDDLFLSPPERHVVTALVNLPAARGRASISAQPGSVAGAPLAPSLGLELSQSLLSERAGARGAGSRTWPRGPLGGAAAAVRGAGGGRGPDAAAPVSTRAPPAVPFRGAAAGLPVVLATAPDFDL